MTKKHRKTETENGMNLRMMEEGIALLLEGMRIPRSDPNFSETPERVARMFKEMLTPERSNWATFPSASSDLVLLRGHRVFALCPHHLQVVEMKCYIAYIPNKKTLGLSKLARAVEEHLTHPILQEDLANAVADTIEAKLEPKGTGVVLTGRHGCMAFRGVESDGDVVTSVMRGVFLLNPTARQELLTLIGRP